MSAQPRRKRQRPRGLRITSSRFPLRRGPRGSRPRRRPRSARAPPPPTWSIAASAASYLPGQPGSGRLVTARDPAWPQGPPGHEGGGFRSKKLPLPRTLGSLRRLIRTRTRAPGGVQSLRRNGCVCRKRRVLAIGRQGNKGPVYSENYTSIHANRRFFLPPTANSCQIAGSLSERVAGERFRSGV